jgi:hypothetical protein
MVPLVPVMGPSDVAVTVCSVPAVVLVVKATVATPLPSVVLVGEVKLPPFVLLHVTTTPGVVTGLSFASASCAVIVTLSPATTLDALDETRYFAADPALTVVVRDAVLLVTSGSEVSEVALAEFVLSPRVLLPTLTVSVYCWLAPLASVARAGHVTVWPTTEAGAGVADW